MNKFAKFGLTAVAGTKVDAPLIKECYANFECRLYDGSQISKHGLFIWEVVKAHIAISPKYPETVHYRGEGVFMISGRSISRRSQFKAQNLRCRKTESLYRDKWMRIESRTFMHTAGLTPFLILL